jgi:cytoskeletal protein RodZ
MRKTGIALAAALLLAGCGSDTGQRASEEPPAASGSKDKSDKADKADSMAGTQAEVKPANGERINAKSFRFALPKGWTDVTEKPTDAVMIRAADLSGDSEVPAQMVVGRASDEGGGIASLEERGQKAMESSGLTRVTVDDPAEVDGTEAAVVRAVQPQKGAPLAVSSYYVARNGTAWHITFSASRWLVPKDRQRTIDSVLASWHWR